TIDASLGCASIGASGGASLNDASGSDPSLIDASGSDPSLIDASGATVIASGGSSAASAVRSAKGSPPHPTNAALTTSVAATRHIRFASMFWGRSYATPL